MGIKHTNSIHLGTGEGYSSRRGDIITAVFINKPLFNVQKGKEETQAKPSVPRMLQPFTAWQRRRLFAFLLIFGLNRAQMAPFFWGLQNIFSRRDRPRG